MKIKKSKSITEKLKETSSHKIVSKTSVIGTVLFVIVGVLAFVICAILNKWDVIKWLTSGQAMFIYFCIGGLLLAIGIIIYNKKCSKGE